MTDEEAQVYQSPEWETAGGRKRSSIMGWLRSSRPLVPADAPKEPPIKESTREPSIEVGTSTNIDTRTPIAGSASFLDSYFPPDKKYLGLRRNYFLLFVVTPSILILLIILPVALGVGLSDRDKSQNLPFPSSSDGPWKGDITYYDPGMGACGWVSKSGEMIVAVSHELWDSIQEGGNPNTNSLCGKKIRVRRDFVEENKGQRSVDVTVVDRCTGCKPTDLDLSPTAYKKLAREVDGRVLASWTWLD